MKKKIMIMVITCVMCLGLNTGSAEAGEMPVQEKNADQAVNNNEIPEATSESPKMTAEPANQSKEADGAGENDNAVLTDLAAPGIIYTSHIQNVGWSTQMANGATSGSVGMNRRIEAIKISLQNINGLVTYRSKGINQSWQDWKKDGAVSGTEGKAIGLERIEIKLDDALSDSYDIFYRVHVANLGWLGWSSNGTVAGSAYYDYAIEAIEIKILPKGDTFAPITGNSFKQKTADITYQAHVSNIGWQASVKNGAMGGTTGQKKKVEAIKIKVPGITSTELQYRTKTLSQNWQGWKSNNEQAGTTGQSLGLEQLQIKLQGDIAQEYSVYYRVHVGNIGWLGWTCDGGTAGSSYHGGAIEAIEIKLVKKGESAPSTGNAFREMMPSVTYSAHVSNIGWKAGVKDGVIGGTTGQSKKIEAIKIQITNAQTTNDITYSTRSIGKSWGEWSINNAISGTTGQNLGIDGIKIKLSDSLSQKYSVYYRVHVANVGWLGWTKDGDQAGSEGFGYAIEAVQIKIMVKGQGEMESTAYVKMPSLNYQAHVANIGWQSGVTNGITAGTTGQNMGIEALMISLTDNETYSGSITYRTRGVKSSAWDSWVTDGMITGSTGQSESLEGIQIKLTGDIANAANVYYRTYVTNVGWLGWSKNGNSAGSEYYSYRIEAIQVKILPKSDNATTTGTAYLLGMQHGVDVSHYNGTINWSKVKASGITFAMLRGVNGKMGNLQVDSTFNTNIKDAAANGVKVGVYRYGYAVTVAQAQQEAVKIVEAIKASGCKVQYPVVYDVEDADTQGKLTKAELTSIIKAFKGIIENNGYKFMIYANKTWLENKIDMDTFANEDIWIARYRDNTWNLGHGYTGKGNITMWQYTSSGTVPGISGEVDMNICYKQY